MADKIDIHNIEKQYDRILGFVDQDKSILRENKELILKYLLDCQLGKTIKNRSKKKLGKARLVKIFYTLKNLSKMLNKPFPKVTQKDMEDFILNLENDAYGVMSKNKRGKIVKTKNYSEETKLDYKRILKKFYKWLLGNNKHYPELVDFIDTTPVRNEIPAFTRDEVEKVIYQADEIWKKAAIMVLFDGGMRIEELLNIRLQDIEKKEYENNECYWVNIRVSKTEPRTIPLPLSTRYLKEYLAVHKEKDNPDSQLFPYRYNNFKNRIQRLFLKILNKKITLHQLRHSSATYWANLLEPYKLCYKFGWSLSSRSPDRYIKRKGIILKEMAKSGDVDKISILEKENKWLKESLNMVQANIKELNEENKKRDNADNLLFEFIKEFTTDKINKDILKKKMKEKVLGLKLTEVLS